MGSKSTRLGGQSLNNLGIGGLATDRETQQRDNDVAMTKSINKAAIALSQLYNSTSISDLSNTQLTKVCTEYGHYTTETELDSKYN